MSTTNSYPTFATSVSNLSAFFRESAEKAMKEDDRTGLAPHMLMKILGISTLLAVTLPAPSVAEAKGCIKVPGGPRHFTLELSNDNLSLSAQTGEAHAISGAAG
jgi:hypothetical protein